MPPSTSRSRARAQVVLSVAGALFGLALAVVLFLRLQPDTGASFVARGYEVLSDTSVRLDIEVARSPGTPVFCVVRARAADGAEVGRAEVEVPPTTRRTTLVQPLLTTTRRAVNGEVLGCARRQAPRP